MPATLRSFAARDLYLGRTLTFSEDRMAKIEALSPADVQAALAKYVQPAKLVVGKRPGKPVSVMQIGGMRLAR
jgi:predicted Zn-dependent peptidase